jgi:hypothetical protein
VASPIARSTSGTSPAATTASGPAKLLHYVPQGENGRRDSIRMKENCLEPFTDKGRLWAPDHREIAGTCEVNVRSAQRAGGHEAAIDRDDCTGDIVGLVRSQKRDQRSHF